MDPSKPLEIRGMAVKSICNIITHYVSGDTLIRKFQTMLRSGSYYDTITFEFMIFAIFES